MELRAPLGPGTELAAGSFGSEIDRFYFECILKTVDRQINCFVVCSIEYLATCDACTCLKC